MVGRLLSSFSRLPLSTRNTILSFATLGMIFTCGILPTSIAHAASLSNFNPGYIIDDSVMVNKSSMTEAQIQSFLKGEADCNSTGNGYINSLTIVDNGTRGYVNGTMNVGGQSVPATWWWNLKDGHFVCMADDTFNGETAAHIIWQASQDYNVNPQVLIVLLQKEQGLVTDGFPNNHQYAAATGYDCPDNGSGCNSANAGFKNQIRKAANLFHEVMDNTDYDGDGFITNYPVGVNTIKYNPDPSCGSSQVNIINRATSALYRYTPYQPNAAALAAGYGTAPCGAYGNRNFYLYFNDWFGSSLLKPGFRQILDRYSSLGGASGELGTATGDPTFVQSSNKSYQQYQNGIIIWTASTGAWEIMSGPIRDRLAIAGGTTGPLGFPTGPNNCPQGTSFCVQSYQNGVIISNPGTGTWENVGAIRQRFVALGSVDGPLGFPTGPSVSNATTISQQYQHGSIIYNLTTEEITVKYGF